MRGRIVIPLPVPTGGIATNVPPHRVPQTSLSDGLNMYVDVDGLLKPRNGYAPAVVTGPGARISGGVGYLNSNGTVESVCATLTDWWALVNNVWTKITDGANPQTGSASNPARFAVFFSNGAYNVDGVNNVNPLRSWVTGAAKYTTPTNAPIAVDILVLSNRVVVFNTIESGTRYPRRARWSSSNDDTTWGTLNYNDMLDSDDAIIAARKTGRQSAAVYGAKSIWTVQANSGGDDASAFTTEELFAAQNYSGPIGTAAVVVAEGSHYYLGTDGRVYQFNGVQPQAISDPIDGKVIAALNSSYGARCHAVYLPAKRLVVFFWPAGIPIAANEPVNQQDCFNASVFSLARGVWEPPWVFPEAITASWQTQIVSGLTWATDPYTWLTSPYRWQDIPDATAQGVYIGTLAGQVHNFFNAFSDNGTLVPYSAVSGLLSLDPAKSYLLDRAEIYFPATQAQELVSIQFDGFGAPFVAANPIVSIGAAIGSEEWINQMMEPGALNPNNIESNFLRLKIFSGGSQGGMAFAGGNIYLNDALKSDYGTN